MQRQRLEACDLGNVFGISQVLPSVTGGGNLVWVGVLRVTGVKPDQGG